MVKRKHRVHQTSKPRPVLSPHQQKLKEENRCFNCFAKGHKKSLCMGKVRCIKCFKLGHFSRQCQSGNNKEAVNREVNAKVAPAKNQMPIKEGKETAVQRHNISSSPAEKNHKPAPNKPKQMDFSDWENVPLQDPDSVESNRAEDIHVFLEERDQFFPSNQFLDRTAIAMTGPNENTQFLAHRLATRLAMYFRRQPRDFKVRKVHQSIGDLIAIFPNRDMLKEACDICVFALGPRVEVQLAPWTTEAGTMYDPTSNLARIKIYSLPFNRWNRRDVGMVVSGFGQLVRVAPFFQNDNYEYITALVDVRHIDRVPRYATVGTKSRPCTVQIELDGWIYTSDFETPVEHRDRRDDRGQPSRGGSNMIEHHPLPARHSTTANHHPRITDGRDRQTPRRHRNKEGDENPIISGTEEREREAKEKQSISTTEVEPEGEHGKDQGNQAPPEKEMEEAAEIGAVENPTGLLHLTQLETIEENPTGEQFSQSIFK